MGLKMFKIIFSTILIIPVINSKNNLMDNFIDKVAVEVVRIGDPTHLYLEDIDTLKNLCETYGESVLKAESEKLSQFFKGLTLKLVKSVLPLLAQNSREACVLLKNGEGDKVVRVSKKINKKVDLAMKVRNGFVTALTQILKNDTKTTYPQLICYIQQFCDKMLEIYADDDEAKATVHLGNHSLFGRVIEMLEKEKGRKDSVCQLPDASSNPSDFNSVMVPLIKAIEKIEMS